MTGTSRSVFQFIPQFQKCHYLIASGAIAAVFISSLDAQPSYGLDNSGLQVVVPANKRSNNEGFSYEKLAHGVQVRCGAIVRNVLFYGPSVVRVNSTLGRVHTRQPSLAVTARPPKPEFSVDESANEVILGSGSLTVRIHKDSGAIDFIRPDGSIFTRENRLEPVALGEQMVSGSPTYQITQRLSLADNESLYGLGQYDKAYMDYRGCKVDMTQTNIGIVIPFLISTNRYGILWDAYSKCVFNDDNQGTSLWAESAPAGSDYYFIGGRTMDEVVSGYRYLTGAAPMFPKAAFGLFMSKERYPTQSRLIDVVRNFRNDGFPIDYIVQDWQYWGGNDGTWSGMTWDKQRFPDPKGLTKTLHDELHVKLMNSIWPTVGDDTALARELDAKKLRFEPLHWISKKARVYDAFSPEGRAIYFKHIKKGLLDAGVDALWMDGTEVEVSTACHDPRQVETDIKGLGTNAMGDFTRYLNAYSLVTTKGVYEGQRATSNKRVLTLTRSAYIGQQRFAAMPWSGDTTASWETLRKQIPGGLNVCMAGQPYWTQDTGGFFVNYPGGHLNAEYRELFARWNQFGIFNPVYRIHGTNIEREPYVFRELDPEVYQSLRSAARLRYQLIPYIYSLAWQCTSNGYTMMRALPMDFPDESGLRKIDDQFMFGPALLVHPVTRAMERLSNPAPPAVPAEFLSTPNGQPGMEVEYFDGTGFQKSTGRMIDRMVAHSWPGPPLEQFPGGIKNGYNFSARWNGFITAPDSGEYEIGIEADDGFRLWLDDALAVEDWNSRPALYKGKRVQLSAGQKVRVRIEYYQGGNARSLRLGWRQPSELSKQSTKVDHSMVTRLPAGNGWYDFWTNEFHPGGRNAVRECPLDILPLYVRAGSILPFGPEVQYATEKPDAPCELRIYPGKDASFTMYEDDNETYAYESGKHATVDLSWDDGRRVLKIGERKGTFPGMTSNRVFKIRLMTEPGKEHSIPYQGSTLKVQL